MELVKASYTVRHLTVMDSNSAWSRVLSRSLIVTWQTGTSRPRTTKSKHGKAPALEALTPPAWRRRRRSCVPQPPTRLWPLQGRSSMRLFSTAFCHVSDCSSLSERCWHAALLVKPSWFRSSGCRVSRDTMHFVQPWPQGPKPDLLHKASGCEARLRGCEHRYEGFDTVTLIIAAARLSSSSNSSSKE